MPRRKEYLTVGQVARRSGVAASALRFYESKGLIHAERNAGNQRRYERAVLRRVAIIRAAQTLGLSLDEIGAALSALPADATPTKRDWARMSRQWSTRLDEQIRSLEQLREKLTGCIGCGCLSLNSCALFNAEDAAANLGDGPRYLMGDSPSDT